jgi:hypothetical protein
MAGIVLIVLKRLVHLHLSLIHVSISRKNVSLFFELKTIEELHYEC